MMTNTNRILARAAVGAACKDALAALDDAFAAIARTVTIISDLDDAFAALDSTRSPTPTPPSTRSTPPAQTKEQAHD